MLIALGESFYIFFSQLVALILFNTSSTKILGEPVRFIDHGVPGHVPLPIFQTLFFGLVLKPDPSVHICLDCQHVWHLLQGPAADFSRSFNPGNVRWPIMHLAILHVVKASEKVVTMCLWALLVLCDKQGVCARKPVLARC